MEIPFNTLEFKKAIFQMGATKSPGSDSMPALFSQKYWNIVGLEVTEAVLNFLNYGDFIDKINQTFIFLIPKVKSLENMKQFHLISLCNVFYKIISRVLPNKLKIIFPSIISTTHSAFVQNRHITDNVLVAYDITHALKNRRSGKDSYMALRLDMSKAYDRVE